MIDLRQAYREYKTKGLVPPHRAIWSYYKNRNIQFQYVKKADWIKNKTSDTLFIFGSGPSINSITDEEWSIIKSHDSMGLNHVFLIRHPMTFYYCGYEPGSNSLLRIDFTKDIRAMYEHSVWFVPMKSLYRLYHPRIIPEFFPPNSKIALFDYPKVLSLECDRPFNLADFQKSLIYRGVMCVGLYFADQLQYKNIILLGIDLHTYRHFFDDYDVTKTERETYNKTMQEKTGGVFESMIPKGSMYRTMEEYYYAVNEMFFRPKKVRLYVGNKNSMLSPRIPLYPFFQ